MRFVMARLIALYVCMGLAAAAPATAQPASAPPETRAEVLQRAREEKRQSATPYEPGALERGMRLAEERLAPLLVGRDGVHWKLGSLTTGSGFAYGMGYRHRRLLDREGALNLWAAASLKKYWAAEARFDMPSLAAGRLMLGVRARRQSYPQEDFFGVGPGSRRGDHTTFQISNTIVGGQVGVRAAPRLTIGAGVEYSRPEVGRGRNTKVPTIEALFADSTAPGLGGGRNFVRTSAFLDFDYRQPKNARRGG